MIAVFSLPWGKKSEYEHASQAMKDEFACEYGPYKDTYSEYVGDPSVALKIFGEINLKRIINNEYTDRLFDIITKLENASKNIVNARTLNEKCNVHVGGHSLLVINETMLLEDECTDKLQLQLDRGWRIIAACVQPDGRRPDYILGRYNSDKDK